MIYSTPFSAETMKCTGNSVETGFDSLDEAEQLMGPADVRPTPGTRVYYGAGDERTLLSRVPFYADPA